MLRGVARHFPSFRCIAPDLPLGGHALPLNADADLTPPGIAIILGRFLDALGLEDVIPQAAAASLAGFPKPVSIIWGTDDRILFPVELGRRLRAIFPNATLDLIDGAATYVQEDQPDAFVRALQAAPQPASMPMR